MATQSFSIQSESMISRLQGVVNEIRDVYGEHLCESTGPLGFVIYDVLSAVGMPLVEIRAVLGPDADVIDDGEDRDAAEG
jgi:hypothetical protein